MRTGFSSSMAGFCKQMSVFEAMKTIKDAGFDSLDFCLSQYSRPLDSPLRQERTWQQWTRSVAEYSAEIGLPVTQAHASWEQSIPSDLHYEPPYDIFYRTFEACHMLGCRKLVFHPVLFLHRIPTVDYYDAIHEFNLRWFRELLPTAEKYDITMELENTFDYRHVQQPGDPPFTYTDAGKMLRLADALASPFVKLCLDTGHANIAAQDVPSMIRTYGKRLDCLHLNDNYGLTAEGYEDLHLFPGYGRLPWPEIITALKEIGFDGVLNMEVKAELGRVSQPIRLAQLRGALEVMRLLARDGGFIL